MYIDNGEVPPPFACFTPCAECERKVRTHLFCDMLSDRILAQHCTCLLPILAHVKEEDDMFHPKESCDVELNELGQDEEDQVQETILVKVWPLIEDLCVSQSFVLFCSCQMPKKIRIHRRRCPIPKLKNCKDEAVSFCFKNSVHSTFNLPARPNDKWPAHHNLNRQISNQISSSVKTY